MWFLARREMAHDKVRFCLVVGLVTLVAFLVFVMTGLSTGLGEASVSGVRSLTGSSDLVVYAPNVQRSLARSDLDTSDAQRVALIPGVTSVIPVGQAMTNLAAPGGAIVTVALVGTDAGTSTDAPGTVIVDASARDRLSEGDLVTVQPGGTTLRVAGFADNGSIQHTAVARTDLAAWQRIRYAVPDSSAAAPPERASALLVITDPGASVGVAAAITGLGLDAATPGDAVSATPGYKEETGTIGLIRGFLFAIAALLVGTIFWVLTIQKEAALAVLRAAGARRGLLIGAYILEVALTTLAGIAVGWIAASAAAQLLPATAYRLRAADAATAAVLLATLALAASATSMRRQFTIDPLLSLGRL